MFTGLDVLAERQRRKLSRTKFAELVGLTPTKIGNIEKGREIRPEEFALLTPFVTVSAASNGRTVLLLDQDLETVWLDLIDTLATTVTPPAAVVVAAPPELTSGSLGGAAPSPDLRFTVGREDPVAAAPAETTDPLPALVGAAALYTEDGVRRVSNSEVQVFKHCRRRWWLGVYRGLRLKDEPATGALSLGTRVHLALAEYYVPAGVAPTDPREALETVIERDELQLVQSLTRLDADAAATVMAAFKKDADLARAMIEGYVQWLAETGADQGYRVIAPEQVLTLLLPTDDHRGSIMLQGRIDVRLQREHDGVVLFMDHKTTGSFEQLTRLLLWDEQMKHYHLLEEGGRVEGAPITTGVLYNMLRKVKRTAAANPPFFQRVEVRHNTLELDRFKTRLIGETAVIDSTERRLEAGEDHQRVVYPSPSGRCLWGCEFSAVCPMFDDGSRAEDFIGDHYVQVNPLDRYTDDETGDET